MSLLPYALRAPFHKPKFGSWGLPEMRDCLYGSGYEDFSSFPNRSPCG